MSRRTSFFFPPAATAELEAIRRRSYLESAPDVIRAAIDCYDGLISMEDDGGRVFITDPGGRKIAYTPGDKFDAPQPDASTEVKTANAADAKNFFFSGEAVDKLEAIKGRTHLQTNADVIRVAISVYSTLLAIHAAGNVISIQDRYGNDTIYNPHRPFARVPA